MAIKNQKWLFMLMMLPGLLCAEESMNELGYRLNREIKTAVQNVHESGPVVVLSQNLERSRDLAEFEFQEDEQNAEEIAFEARRNGLVEKLKSGKATIKDVQGGLADGMFPVRSKLVATKLPSREIVLSQAAKVRFAQPLVVIGNDELSLSWFKLNVDELRRIGATVIVTEVDSAEEFNAIRGLAPDMAMMPIKADMMLKDVGVSVYPIVLTSANAFQ